MFQTLLVWRTHSRGQPWPGRGVVGRLNRWLAQSHPPHPPACRGRLIAGTWRACEVGDRLGEGEARR